MQVSKLRPTGWDNSACSLGNNNPTLYKDFYWISLKTKDEIGTNRIVDLVWWMMNTLCFIFISCNIQRSCTSNTNQSWD